MAIQVLDQSTIDKIAAGEVVERPSSVVKELVENAIDAGATAVTIEIKEGGISFIRITDNGCGIAADEIPLAFLRHSTSKIKSVEDLISVSSLGFRGEALSSIAAVSQVEMITKVQESFTGSRYLIEGGEQVAHEEVGAPDGTTFIVRNLFYNTPVRRKFLKTAATEASYVNSLIEHLSLSHPDISFRFINNNQNRLHTSGNSNLEDIIYNVYGRDITRNLIPLTASTQDVEITGFIGKPGICRGNRSYENYYINGRYIKSPIITKAIEEAYKGFIMLHNYPFTALHFKINPAILDVNVHPTKMELRFSKNDFVYHFVLEAVRKALREPELIPEVEVEVQAPQVKPVDEPPVMPDQYKTAIAGKNVQHGLNEKKEHTQIIEDILQDKQVKQVMSSEPRTPVRAPEPFEQNRFQKMVEEENKADRYAKEKREDAVRQISMFEDKLLDESHPSEYKIIGQLFDTYWLIEYEQRFYMMDQHAAHEKILFERMMKQLKQQTQDTQMILPPVVLTLNMREEQVLAEHLETFLTLGYQIEEFGSRTYKVTGLPAGLPEVDLKRLLLDMLDNLASEGNSGQEVILEKVASMSCKAAVKGNNRLSSAEAQALMKELMEADNPYNCPHGRPTLIVMTKYEIEKKFKRIV